MRFTEKQLTCLRHIAHRGGRIAASAFGINSVRTGDYQVRFRTSQQFTDFLRDYCVSFTPAEVHAKEAHSQRRIRRYRGLLRAALDRADYGLVAKVAGELEWRVSAAMRVTAYYHVCYQIDANSTMFPAKKDSPDAYCVARDGLFIKTDSQE